MIDAGEINKDPFHQAAQWAATGASSNSLNLLREELLQALDFTPLFPMTFSQVF